MPEGGNLLKLTIPPSSTPLPGRRQELALASLAQASYGRARAAGSSLQDGVFVWDHCWSPAARPAICWCLPPAAVSSSLSVSPENSDFLVSTWNSPLPSLRLDPYLSRAFRMASRHLASPGFPLRQICCLPLRESSLVMYATNKRL